VETETGLIYCQQRYYDPAAGRWLTRDPIRHAGGVNLYEYCGGDPVNGADPSGLIIAGPSGQYAPQADGVGDRLKFPVFDIVGGAMVMYACVPNRDGLGWHYQNAGIRGNLQTGLFYDGDKVVLPDGKVVVDPSLVGPVNGDAVRASLAQAGALGLELMRKHVAIGGHPSLAAVAQPAKAVAASPGKYKVVFVTGAYPDRCKAANDMGAICYVEQHFNSFNGKANYTHVVLRTKDPLPESKAWAAAYTAAVSKEYGTDDKGGVPGGMGGRGDNNIKRCTMPAILCEPFFVDIDKGAAWALDTKPGGGQDRLAACLANSVRQQFPGGGLVVFSIGHKGNTANPGDMGTAVNNSKLMEADCAEAVLKKAAALLEE
jgi:uncharacterized protein RhaS with RHS repeats